MSNWGNNETKNAAATPTNGVKNSATVKGVLKGGSAYTYDDSRISYDDEFSPDGSPLYYDSAGLTPTVTNVTKN